MKKILFVFCLSFLSNSIFAQSEWVNGMFSPENNFFVTQENFESFWDEKTIEKGKGWKQFKRWEAFMAPRVNQDGSFPYKSLYREYLKTKNQLRSSNVVQANWTAVGPTQVPLQSSGRKRGIGRLNVIEFDPNNPSTLWVGAPAGGLWKSTDAGLSWTSNTDLLPNLGVSDIAIDPTNSDIMFIATGDRDAGDTYSYGIMKSQDGGLNWDSTGLSFSFVQSYRGNRILINPSNTDQIIVSTRRASGTGEVYRSIDGGDNFNLQLQKNLISMEFNPTNPNIIYGGSQIGGPAGFFKSTDNGQNWTQITNGLPSSGVDRCQIAVTPANPDIVYALFCGSDDGFYGLYKSIDQGNTWIAQSDSSNAPNLLGWSSDGTDSGGQGWYDLSLTVSPTDENLIFVGGVNTWQSNDGGVNWNISSHWYGGGGVEYKHADEHYLRYNEDNGILYSANDGGLYYSNNDGQTWTDISDGLQISQFYRSGVSQTNSDLIISGAQDNGTLLMNGLNFWSAVRGGDGMECAIDPTNPNIMYSTVYYGALSKSNNGGDSWNDIAPANDGAWVTPFTLDPSNPNRIVAGYQEVWESNDGGNSWNSLTNGQAGGTIDAIAVAKSDGNVIYFSEYNEIYVTQDNGQNWLNINNNLPNRSISYISIDPNDAGKVWISYSGFGNGNKVYKTSNYGASWTNISAGLPNLPANCVIINNNNPASEELYVATDLGVYYRDTSLTLWEPFNNGLPNVIVNELEIQYQTNELIATTYGRGVWKTSLPITSPPIADFTTNDTSFCNIPAEVTITNSSLNSSSFYWDFGDGNTSTDFNPTHTYTSFGNYTVSLISTGPLGSDTIIQNNVISIFPSNPCVYLMPVDGVGDVIDACSGTLYDSGGNSGDYSNNVNSIVTIAPNGANQITLTFSEFGIEAPSSSNNCNFDYVEIFDGPDTNSTSLGQYCNTLTGSPGTIISSGGAITIYLHSDGGVTDLGFEAYWNCIYPNQAPETNFTIAPIGSCNGDVQFIDQTIYNPNSWQWDFGDGTTSIDQHPFHTYTQDGLYNITLITSNNFGADTLQITNYIDITIATPPNTLNDTVCSGSQAILTANGGPSNSLFWYNNITGGIPIHIGDSFVTSPLYNSTTYYVEKVINYGFGGSIFGGPADNNTLGSGGYHTNDAWDMTFDCSNEINLISVEMYADSPFTSIIEILDDSGNQIHSQTVSFIAGLNTVNLNFNIPAGNNYQIGINGTNDGLYRNDNVPNGVFPIDIGNSVQITGNTTSSPLDYFYYFYNWEIEELQSCNLNRIPVTAHVYPNNQVTINPDTVINLCFGDSIQLLASTNFVQYNWNNGSTDDNIWVYSDNNFSVTAIDSNGCSSQAATYVNIANETIGVVLTTPACLGDSACIQADNGYASYDWNTGDSIRTIFIQQDGTYDVIATDNNNCTLNGSISVIFNTPTLANISLLSNEPICENDPFSLTANSSMSVYLWSSGDNTESITLSEPSAGTYEYWTEIIDLNGCASTDTISVVIDSCSSFIDDLFDKPITLFPNPNNGTFTVSHESVNNDILSIAIYNLQGKSITIKDVQYQDNILLEKFELDNISKGVYLIQINTILGSIHKKIVIQ